MDNIELQEKLVKELQCDLSYSNAINNYVASLAVNAIVNNLANFVDDIVNSTVLNISPIITKSIKEIINQKVDSAIKDYNGKEEYMIKKSILSIFKEEDSAINDFLSNNW